MHKWVVDLVDQSLSSTLPNPSSQEHKNLFSIYSWVGEEGIYIDNNVHNAPEALDYHNNPNLISTYNINMYRKCFVQQMS